MTTPVTPHIKDGYAPLNELIKRAIRRFGDFGTSAITGDVEMMFMEFANQVIDEYKQHPYFDGREGLHHYTDSQESQAIEDEIMLAGLIAHYSFQQMSEKTPGYQSLYYQTMNRTMWQVLNGNTAIKMRPMDGGSNKAHSDNTSVTNGLTDDEAGVTTDG